jgi:hypothetical protein
MGEEKGKESEEDWKRKRRARNDKRRGEECRKLIYVLYCSRARGGEGVKRREKEEGKGVNYI